MNIEMSFIVWISLKNDEPTPLPDVAFSEIYSEPCQTSKMEYFTKIV